MGGCNALDETSPNTSLVKDKKTPLAGALQLPLFPTCLYQSLAAKHGKAPRQHKPSPSFAAITPQLRKAPSNRQSLSDFLPIPT